MATHATPSSPSEEPKPKGSKLSWIAEELGIELGAISIVGLLGLIFKTFLAHGAREVQKLPEHYGEIKKQLDEWKDEMYNFVVVDLFAHCPPEATKLRNWLDAIEGCKLGFKPFDKIIYMLVLTDYYKDLSDKGELKNRLLGFKDMGAGTLDDFKATVDLLRGNVIQRFGLHTWEIVVQGYGFLVQAFGWAAPHILDAYNALDAKATAAVPHIRHARARVRMLKPPKSMRTARSRFWIGAIALIVFAVLMTLY
jgi:hypothetical protein